MDGYGVGNSGLSDKGGDRGEEQSKSERRTNNTKQANEECMREIV